MTDIYVIKKRPHGLTGAAIKAARGISFTPAVKDGHPGLDVTWSCNTISIFIRTEVHAG